MVETTSWASRRPSGRLQGAVGLALALELFGLRAANGQVPSPPRTESAARWDLVDLAATRASDVVPKGWQARPVRGQRSPTTLLSGAGDARRWLITSAGQAGWFAYDLRRRPLPAGTQVEMSFRLMTLPAGADLADPRRNDAALRLFVIFRGSGRLVRGDRMLLYSFGNLIGPERVATPRAGLCDIRLARTATESWETVRFDPADDAVKSCGWPAARMIGIGILHDTDQTGAAGHVEIRMLRVDAPPTSLDSI